MAKIKVLIADGFDIFRHGIKSILADEQDIVLSGAFKSAKELVKEYSRIPSAICVISSSIPDSNIHDLTKALYQINPEARVIVLTNSTDIAHLNQSLKAGVKGYLTKNISARELAEAVKSVASGDEAFGKSVSKLMIGKYADLAKNNSSQSLKLITKREKEVLKLIVEGYTSPEIAKILFISSRTVETHRSNLMNKLEIKNTAALVRFALEEGDLS